MFTFAQSGEWLLFITVVGGLVGLFGIIGTSVWAVGRIKASADVLSSRMEHFERSIHALERSIADMNLRMNQHSSRIIRLEERVMGIDPSERTRWPEDT